MLRFVMVMSFGLVASTGAAADWPEFRGPEGKGVYTGKPLPLTWGAETNVTWKTAIPGLGWSSPIAVKGKLYFTTAVEVMNYGQKDFSLRAVCVDAESGSRAERSGTASRRFPARRLYGRTAPAGRWSTS